MDQAKKFLSSLFFLVFDWVSLLKLCFSSVVFIICQKSNSKTFLKSSVGDPDPDPDLDPDLDTDLDPDLDADLDPDLDADPDLNLAYQPPSLLLHI